MMYTKNAFNHPPLLQCHPGSAAQREPMQICHPGRIAARSGAMQIRDLNGSKLTSKRSRVCGAAYSCCAAPGMTLSAYSCCAAPGMTLSAYSCCAAPGMTLSAYSCCAAPGMTAGALLRHLHHIVQRPTAAIGVDRLAGDVGSVVARPETPRSPRSPTVGRNVRSGVRDRQVSAAQLVYLADLLQHFGCDRSGADGVDADAIGARARSPCCGVSGRPPPLRRCMPREVGVDRRRRSPRKD